MWISSVGGMMLAGKKIEVLEEKPVPVPLHSPQIPHGMVWYRTRTSAATNSVNHRKG
jgi:hypothetical protein